MSSVPAPPQPERLTIGGITYEDPYLWLERPTPETEAWQAAQDEAAAAFLHQLPAFHPLLERVAPHLREMHTYPPRVANGRWFRLEPAREHSPLYVSGAAGEIGDVLVDPVEHNFESVEWFWPSPDGTHVALGLREGPAFESVLHVVNVASGSLLPLRAGQASACRVAWLPDSSGFYFNAGLPEDDRFGRHLFRYDLGGSTTHPPEPLQLRSGQVFPQVSADGRYLAAIVSFTALRPDYIKRLDDDDGWQPFLRDNQGSFFGVFFGDTYIAVTDDNAPLGRVISIPIGAPGDRRQWQELVPESDAVIRGVALVDQHAVLTEIVDGSSRLRIFHLTETGELDSSGRVVDLPVNGAVGIDGRSWSHMPIEEPNLAAGAESVTFVFSSYTRSPAVMSYTPAGDRLEVVTKSRFDHRDLSTQRLHCRASDGGTVGMWVISRNDLDLSVPQPTVLYGYGGWNNAFLPFYLGGLIPLVQAGGVVVLPNLRGGGENGSGWWQEGRLKRKQATFDDLYACAEWLIAGERTAPDRLAILGQSNGGLLAAAALTQRPDLFSCAIVLVPVLEMMRYSLNVLSHEGFGEYGNPNDPKQAPFLYAYSPYHNVTSHAYPPTLLVAAEHDTACPAWQSRKMTARLQLESTSNSPVLFRLWRGAEHIAGEIATPEQTAEWVAFLMNALNIEYRE